MTTQQYYLLDSVYFDPLINSWYAWPYLLPPVTNARHTTNTHLRIMKSFVNNHKLHLLATKEKTLAGGDFLNVESAQVGLIQEYINKIETELSAVVDLSNAVKELEDILRQHTSGKSIDYIYEQVPEQLRGKVEIFLDLEHQPSYRLIEPLIYRSELYRKNMQSLSLGKISKIGERPFVLSTPRIPDQNHLIIDIDFNHPAVDQLFRMREHPESEENIKALAEQLSMKGGIAFDELFSKNPPEYKHKPTTEGVKTQYIGHAGFLIESKDYAILIDPFIATRDDKNKDKICSFTDLPPKIDFILITHNHQDHLSLETLLQLRYKTDKVLVPKNNGGSLADPSMRLMLKMLNFDTYEVDDLDEWTLPNLTITSIPFLGEHGDLNIRSKCGWLLEIDGRRMYFGADSSNPDEQLYAQMKDLLSNLDLFAIGMECIGAPYTWLYGALHTKMVPKNIRESRRLNGSDFKQAKKMIDLLNPASIYIYALGVEPWYKYFMGIDYDDQSEQIIQSNQLIDYCSSHGFPIKSLYAREIITMQST